MRKQLIDHFKWIAGGHKHSPEYLADSVINLIDYTKERIEQRDRIDRHIEKAVDKINAALAELDKLKELETREGELSSDPRAELLRHNLEVAKTEAGSFGDHAPITRAKIVLRGDDYQVDSWKRRLGDPAGKNIRYLSALEGFWFAEFNRKRGEDFYEIVSIALASLNGQDSNNTKTGESVKQAFRRQSYKWREKMESNNGKD
jgi:hypothetical protein